MKLGIFDSGIGGEAVASALQTAFPEASIITVNDRKHLPYGDRTISDISTLTTAAIQPLLAANCDVIVLACNTATAAAIDTLRSTYPDQLFIGLEPMVKPAALLTKHGAIAVCATPATLASERYQKLKHAYADTCRIIEPDCSAWATMIESDTVNETLVAETIESVCAQGVDVIVLACTHYHWIRESIEKAAVGRAVIIDPSDAIARQVQNLLESR